MVDVSFSKTLTSEQDTIDFASTIAPHLQAGDCLLLSGEIGAGKSAFARALIRARLGRFVDVPSPTFTLVQVYDHADGDLWHCDLYRLVDANEVIELGLDEAMETSICLIEWPDRLGELTPPDAAQLAFCARDDDHQVIVTSPAKFAKAFEQVMDQCVN